MNDLIDQILNIVAYRIDNDNVDPLENIGMEFAQSLSTFELSDLSNDQLTQLHEKLIFNI
jgi:hypothetical protein